MLKADAGTLCAALAKVVPVIERRATIPIMDTVRLAVKGAILTVSATNLDQQIDVQALVEGVSGETYVPARQLHSILRLLGKRETVELTRDEERLAVAWNGGRLTLPTLPPSDFPEMTLGDVKIAVVAPSPAEAA